MIARVVAGVTGLLLLVAAIVSWTVDPVVTALLVAFAVVIMSLWQFYRRRAGIEPVARNVWTTIVVPLTFGLLAVTALNGWIFRISADSGGESGEVGMLVGLITGVIGMSAAYGYGRIRAQKAQIAALDDEGDDEL
ncbi:hypothetical protein [Gordonia zhaorongruii]|uniref:hypothetical protein n=1 Tax=Gordonia zhaorongruii TaxID=2597659 RepID=UPI001042FFC6|nr:hypothetical protein [Gordonia zhaorongruii]